MKIYQKVLSALVLMCFTSGVAQAQIALAYNDTTICPGNTIEMCAAFTGEADPLNTDDKFTGTIDIGFDFVFFGNTYSTCTVSDNGFLSFNASTLAGLHSDFTWTQSTGSGEANNAIHAAMVDLYLPASGQIRYQYFGTPGERRFIVEWCDVALYGTACNNLRVTTQIILYEGSNIIEIHTTNLDPILGNCPGASGTNLVVQGVRDATGATSVYTPGRDPLGNWGTTGDINDAVRYTPAGANNYTVDSIAFDPWIIIDEVSSALLKWYAPQNPNIPIATGACATVSPTADIHYYTVRYDGLAGCGNDTVSFVDTVRIHYATTYDTVDVEICSGETYNFYGKEYYATGIYDTLFSSAMGCDSLITLNLTVNPLPELTLNHKDRLIDICEQDSVYIFLVNPDPGVTYQWLKDGSPIPGSSSWEIYLSEPGVYRVEAITGKGCEAVSEELKVVVHDKPVAEILSLDDEVICAFDTIVLNAAPYPDSRYLWSPEKYFRYYNVPENPEVKGVFPEPTWVTLTVVSSFGCTDSTGTMVLTKPCCEVFLPNAFSPNGDGLNDYFIPQLQPSQMLVSLRIYNRLGQLIYDNNQPLKGWDGNYSDGTMAATDTYMYLIEYTCADGKNYQDKGSLSLIR